MLLHRLLASAALSAIALSAQAQVVPEQTRTGGSQFLGTLEQRFEADTNFGLDPDGEDTSYFSTTGIGIAFISETRSQRFALFSDLEARLISRDGDDLDFVTTLPSLSMEYERSAEISQFRTEASFRETSLRARRPAEGGFDAGGSFVAPGDLTPEDGTGKRRDLQAGVELQFGIDGPMESRFSLSGAKVDYTGAGTDLNDSVELRGAFDLRFEVTPVLAAVVSGSGLVSDIDTATEDERTVAEGRFGWEYDVSEILSLTAGAGYSLDERITTVETERLAGPTLDAGFMLDLQRTSVTGVAEVLFPEEGDPVFLGSLDATREWRTGQTTARIALETTDSGDTVTTLLLSARQEFAGGVFDIGGSRALDFSRTGDDLVITSGGIAYTRELSRRLAVRAEAAAAVSENLDTDMTDRTQFRFTFGGEYQLTERATLSASYSHRRQSLDEDASGHAISVAIEIPFGF